MKIKSKNKKTVGTSVEVTAVDGIIELTHFQSVKQSINYNSADCSYGAKIRVKDDPKQIKAAIKRLETLIEDRLSTKFVEQRDVLESISGK